MFNNFEELFSPKSLNDITYPNDESKQLIDDLITGRHPFPITEGKSGILLYGVPGTGKSALAKLLTDAIEKARGGSDSLHHYYRIEPSNDGKKLIKEISSQVSLIPFAKFHYFILDEVDCLNKDAMTTLKSVMNYPNTVWILTTNNFKDIENGIKDRSHCFAFNAAPAHRWIPYCKKILKHAGISNVSDQQLCKIIETCNGSARKITSAMTSLALKVHNEKSPKIICSVKRQV